MKRIAMAAYVMLAGTALAQAPEAPVHKCDKPVAPGMGIRGDPAAMRMFNRELTSYRECITKFIEERQAIAKANAEAANAAITEYNAVVRQAQGETPAAPGKLPSAGSVAPPPKGY